MKITTRRLTLIASERLVAQAELTDRAHFAALLDVRVPDNWPPETAADALPWFLEQLEADPANFGWLAWYVIRERAGDKPSERIAGIGFKGRPDADGTIEVGYSVLPQFQRHGYAGEMLAGILGWAFAQPGVTRVLADTMPSNIPSIRLLTRQGFVLRGPGSEEGSHLFERIKPAQ